MSEAIYELLVSWETDSNPHKKLKTSPQIRAIFGGTQICMCISKNKNQINMSKGALYRKGMHYGIKMSTKHPSETNNNFENSYLKPVIIFCKKYNFLQYSNGRL